jgi:hypothetical protein
VTKWPRLLRFVRSVFTVSDRRGQHRVVPSFLGEKSLLGHCKAAYHFTVISFLVGAVSAVALGLNTDALSGEIDSQVEE